MLITSTIKQTKFHPSIIIISRVSLCDYVINFSAEYPSQLCAHSINSTQRFSYLSVQEFADLILKVIASTRLVNILVDKVKVFHSTSNLSLSNLSLHHFSQTGTFIKLNLGPNDIFHCSRREIHPNSTKDI